MSDMLARLHARARGSDLCLHRRTHFRFAPVVSTLNEGPGEMADPLAAALDDPIPAEPDFGDAAFFPAAPVEPTNAAAERPARRRILRRAQRTRRTAEAGGTPPPDKAGDADGELGLDLKRPVADDLEPPVGRQIAQHERRRGATPRGDGPTRRGDRPYSPGASASGTRPLKESGPRASEAAGETERAPDHPTPVDGAGTRRRGAAAREESTLPASRPRRSVSPRNEDASRDEPRQIPPDPAGPDPLRTTSIGNSVLRRRRAATGRVNPITPDDRGAPAESNAPQAGTGDSTSKMRCGGRNERHAKRRPARKESPDRIGTAFPADDRSAGSVSPHAPETAPDRSSAGSTHAVRPSRPGRSATAFEAGSTVPRKRGPLIRRLGQDTFDETAARADDFHAGDAHEAVRARPAAGSSPSGGRQSSPRFVAPRAATPMTVADADIEDRASSPALFAEGPEAGRDGAISRPGRVGFEPPADSAGRRREGGRSARRIASGDHADPGAPDHPSVVSERRGSTLSSVTAISAELEPRNAVSPERARTRAERVPSMERTRPDVPAGRLPFAARSVLPVAPNRDQEGGRGERASGAPDAQASRAAIRRVSPAKPYRLRLRASDAAADGDAFGCKPTPESPFSNGVIQRKLGSVHQSGQTQQTIARMAWDGAPEGRPPSAPKNAGGPLRTRRPSSPSGDHASDPREAPSRIAAPARTHADTASSGSGAEDRENGPLVIEPVRRRRNEAHPILRSSAPGPSVDPGLDVMAPQGTRDRTGTVQRPGFGGRQSFVGPASRPSRTIGEAAQVRGGESKPGDLRIEIGRIEVALPQGRPDPRPRPQPPVFRAKPRGGPDA